MVKVKRKDVFLDFTFLLCQGFSLRKGAQEQRMAFKKREEQKREQIQRE
jgi:hypothetical protein